jgi:hypothetical protein
VPMIRHISGISWVKPKRSWVMNIPMIDIIT